MDTHTFKKIQVGKGFDQIREKDEDNADIKAVVF